MMNLPTPNQMILAAAHDAINGDLKIIDHASGMCLRAVREVIEAAFGMPSHQLYQVYLSDRVERNPGDDSAPWARDFERSVRSQGMAVPFDDRLPGDIVFYWKAAATGTRDAAGNPNYYGHVGILLENDMILENINPKHRPAGFSRQMLSLVPYDRWPYPFSTVARFNPYGHLDAVKAWERKHPPLITTQDLLPVEEPVVDWASSLYVLYALRVDPTSGKRSAEPLQVGTPEHLEISPRMFEIGMQSIQEGHPGAYQAFRVVRFAISTDALKAIDVDELFPRSIVDAPGFYAARTASKPLV
jgi:hypothetical protein